MVHEGCETAAQHHSSLILAHGVPYSRKHAVQVVVRGQAREIGHKIHEALEALQGSDGAEGGYDAVVGVAEIGEDEKLEIIELAHAQKKPDR